LDSGATTLVCGAALQAFLTAAEPSVRFAAGALLFATGEFGNATILGFFVGFHGSGQEQTKNE
jgi:hypothetical protein